METNKKNTLKSEQKKEPGIEYPADFDQPKVEPEPQTELEVKAEVPAVTEQTSLAPVKKLELKKWQDALMALPTKFQELKVEDRRATIELGFAMQIIKGSAALQACEPRSIYDAVIYSARMGITLNPAQGLCYLVPRKGKCCLDVGYKGWRATLVSYGSIQHISGHVVREGDQFSWRPDMNELIHVPIGSATEAEHKARKIVAAYSRAILPSGLVVFEVIEGWELQKIKAVSPASKGFSPYTDWEDEMTKKAPIKRHAKTLQVLQDDDRVRAMFENEKANDEANKPRTIASDWDIQTPEEVA